MVTVILEHVTLSRKLGINKIIGITSHSDSNLRTTCDYIIDMGIIREACPLGLTPTSSSMIMLAISDAIAISLMEKKGCFTKEN